VSKNSLKFLLKYHLSKTKAIKEGKSEIVWDLESERSEIASVIGSTSKNKLKKFQDHLFPELKDFEPNKFFEIIQ
jgi:hypothetical protein